jgi:hypothetical protein
MSILDALRAGVKVADSVTKPLQPLVSYERCTGTDEFGTRTFAAPVTMHAIIDFKAVPVRTKDGITTVTRATLELLSILEVVLATSGEGIADEDRFTLPDGSTGPILDVGGFIDASTGHPIATTVMLG